MVRRHAPGQMRAPARDDLRASRQRLVAAQDDERRRLERNLHDGAQQHLVAIKVKLGLAEMLSTKDPDRARATIVALKHDADEALETLRDLARGIYPPLLADKGLAAALQSQAGKATIPVSVSADGVGRYPHVLVRQPVPVPGHDASRLALAPPRRVSMPLRRLWRRPNRRRRGERGRARGGLRRSRAPALPVR
jgi:hypothetical protein